jgi:PglZ domain
MSFGLDQIQNCETFAGVERALQTAIEERALGKLSSEEHRELRRLIKRRLQGFWSWPERYEEIQPRWRLIQAAVEVIHAAGKVEEGLKGLDGGPEKILRRYAGDLSAVEPWCNLDTYQRRLEHRNLDFSRGVNDEYQILQNLVARSRQHYRRAAEALSERFLHGLREAKFSLPGLPRQTETFTRNVEPLLKSGKKVAYILVDSLRYEMARGLARAMEGDYEVEISAAVGTVPTITEIGMAALMPGADSEVKVVPVSEGKLGLEVEGTVLRDRKDRVRTMEEWIKRASKTMFETQLWRLHSPTRATMRNVKNADLVFVTSQEIDEQGESGNVVTARRFMDQVPSMLRHAVRVLADLGCERIVLAADHGYVFADELDTDTKIDPPGGQTKDLHRRVWVGIGGSDEPYFLRVPLSRMGLSEDLEAAVPWGLGAFKAGGASAYFHGGMSPQEIAIPVLSLVPTKAAAASAPSADVEWEIKLGSKTISTRVISVRVGGRSASLLSPSLPRVLVEVRLGDKVLSEPMVADYDYSETSRDFGLRLEEDGEIEENSVTLIIESDDPQARSGTVSVHLLDAVTNVELDCVEDVELDISV